jgi:acyl carrier protein
MDRNLIKQKLTDILERSVSEPVGVIEESMNLQTDLSLDSVDVVTMAIEIQTEFKIDLKAAELMTLVAVKDLIDLIEKKVAPNRTQAA